MGQPAERVEARQPVGSVPSRTRRPWLTLGVLCLGTFAVLLDTTIVNVALPSLITGLHTSLDQGLWVVNAYLLVFAALLILASRLGDLFGPRRLFGIGLTLFAVASAACGAAQTSDQLIAARVLQGIGAALLTPQAMVIIQRVFPRERMGAAFGVFSSMVGLAAVSGPLLGGLLTTYLSWRWVFYVNLPVAAVGVTLAYMFVPEVRTGRRPSLDVPGVLLASAGLAAVSYGVIEGQRYNWGIVRFGVTIPEIIIAGVVLLAGFAAWERRYRDPLMPPGLFRSRTFTVMVVLNVLVQFALQSMLLVNSLNLQSALGFTAVHAGLTGLPLTLMMSALAPFAGRLTDRIGGKYVLMAGLALYAAGIAGVDVASSAHATSLTFAPALAVAGLGMGAIFAPLATMGMRAAPPSLAGAASGVLNTGRQLGATLGGAIIGAVLASQLSATLPARALADARALPAPARRPFVAGFAAAARSGLQVGRGQVTAHIPAGTPAALIPRLNFLVHDVFTRAYIAAIHPTLAVPAAVLLVGALACLLLSRQPAATGTAAGGQQTESPAGNATATASVARPDNLNPRK
jgi:EmrB/QacA subfamily drug resistance transporter